MIGGSFSSSDDDPEISTPSSYSYYVVELRTVTTPYTDELDKIVNLEKVKNIPSEAYWYRVSGDTKDLVLEEYGLEEYGIGSPTLVLMDTQPEHSFENKNIIIIEMENIINPENTYKIVQDTFYHLNNDEFESLDWEMRKKKLQNSFQEAVDISGPLSSLVSLFMV